MLCILSIVNSKFSGSIPGSSTEFHSVLGVSGYQQRISEVFKMFEVHFIWFQGHFVWFHGRLRSGFRGVPEVFKMFQGSFRGFLKILGVFQTVSAGFKGVSGMFQSVPAGVKKLQERSTGSQRRPRGVLVLKLPGDVSGYFSDIPRSFRDATGCYSGFQERSSEFQGFSAAFMKVSEVLRGGGGCFGSVPLGLKRFLLFSS